MFVCLCVSGVLAVTELGVRYSVCKFLHSNVILFFPLSSYTVLSAAHAARVGSYVSLLLRRHLYKNYVKFFCMRDLSVLHLFTYSVIYLYHYELILIIL